MRRLFLGLLLSLAVSCATVKLDEPTTLVERKEELVLLQTKVDYLCGLPQVSGKQCTWLNVLHNETALALQKYEKAYQEEASPLEKKNCETRYHYIRKQFVEEIDKGVNYKKEE